ncbi:MAG TPA: glycolate oxidase subunit GlcE [Steroidobacteraceae bacterium]|jgi:glycolate oxidase FAD binding subunit|nr:glycolate oxidase subunit GlcE [Steroidobacteraceae bacterium]
MDSQDPVLARLIDQVRLAADRRASLDIRGGGTKAFYGEPAKGEPLDATDLAGISSYEPTELVVTVRAGTPLADLEAALEEHGQCLPFEPPRFSAGGTVGGMVAAGLSGPSRANAGGVREHVLGVTLLNGRGEVLTFGGQVAKNVAGYDVSRLIAGSLGILGVICEVSLKVLPISRGAATQCFEWDESQALEQLSRWASRPLPVNASAWHDGRLHVRLSGAAAAVSAACAKLGGRAVDPETAMRWWSGVRDHTHKFFGLDAAGFAGGERLWRLSVPRTAAPIDLPGRQFIEWHGAERWWRSAADAREVRAAAARVGGHATLIWGADKSGGVFTPLSEVLLKIHRGLKQAFDPAGVFNPGRMYAGL